MIELSASNKWRIVAGVMAAPSRTRMESSRRAPAAVLGAAALMLTVFYAIPPLLHAKAGIAHAHGRPSLVGVANVVGCAAIALLSTWACTTDERRMRPVLAWTVALTTPLLLGVWMMLCGVAYEDPTAHVLGWRCFSMTLALAPWPFAALALVARRIEPSWPRVAGAALGCASGAWAGAMVAAWCPLADAGHVVRGHVLPFVILATTGSLIGRKLLGVRR